MSEPHSAEEALLKRIKEALSKKKTSIQRHALELAYQGFFPIPVAGIVLHRETSELECSCQNFLRFKAERDGLDKPEICGAPGKHPTATNWPARASRDPDKIMALFDPKYNFRRSSIETGINVGIVTGPDTGLVVLDIDGPEGFANLKKLEAENAPLPETIRVVTGSGGLHYYWRSPPGVTILNSVSRIAPKIDFRGQHGQCLAPPSKHKSGGFYEWAEGHSPNDLPLADMPDWLIKLAIEGGEKEAAASAKPGKAKKTSTKSRAGKSRAEGTGWRRFLAEIGDHEGGRGFNAPIGEAILSYFATNGPDADATELLDAIADAVDCAEKDPEKPRSKYERGSEYLNDEVAKAREKIRAQRSEAKASFGDADLIFDDLDSGLDHLSTYVASVLLNGHKIVITEGGFVNFLSPESAKSWLAKVQYMRLDGQGRPMLFPVFPEWVKWGSRPDYIGTDFNPGGDTGRRYNLWRGFATEPAPGDWERVRQHILCILCDGDVKAFEYAIGLLAQLIQQPHVKIGVAWVVIGEEGSGKSIFFDALVSGIGEHAMQASGENDLFNHFNIHQANKVLIYADESPVSGNPAQDEMMKNAITSPTMRKTGKGRDTEDGVKDCRHYVFTMNPQKHRVQLTISDKSRRFFVTQTDESRNQQAPYFEALSAAIGNGMPAMFHDLASYKCDFNTLRVPYRTRAFGAAVERNFAPENRWWRDVLLNRTLPGNLDWSASVKVSKQALVSSYNDWRINRDLRPLDPDAATRVFRDNLPIVSTEAKTGAGKGGAALGRREPAYELPSHEECTAAFEKKHSVSVDPDADPDADEGDTLVFPRRWRESDFWCEDVFEAAGFDMKYAAIIAMLFDSEYDDGRQDRYLDSLNSRGEPSMNIAPMSLARGYFYPVEGDRPIWHN